MLTSAPEHPLRVRAQALNKYVVKVTTGTLTGAGFDGNVWVEMGGWWDSMPEVKLVHPGETTAHLPDGQTVEYELFGVDMGCVTNIKVCVR